MASTSAVPPTRPGMLGVAPVVWPKAIGIISITLGALGAISALWQFVSIFFMGPMMGFFSSVVSAGGGGAQASAQMQATQEAMGELKLAFITAYFCGLVVAILLIVAGAATLRRQPGGVRLHKVYAWMRIVVGVAQVGLQVVFQQRVMGVTLAATPMPAGMGGFMQAMQFVGFAIGLLIICAYPVFVLIWFRRRVVREEVARWGAQAGS